MFPKILDGADVLYYTPYDNFGEIYWDNGEIAHYVKYLAICVYPNKNNEFYLIWRMYEGKRRNLYGF